MQYVFVLMVQRKGFDFIAGVYANITAAQTEKANVEALGHTCRISAEPVVQS